MIGPRAKLVLLAALFALPVVASLAVYHFARPEPTANYGELLLPPATITTGVFTPAEGAARFTFGELAGKWVLVVSDSGECPAACADKLTALRQVRLALGRDALRVERVFVVDDARSPGLGALRQFAGTLVVSGPAAPIPGATNDRAHIYLVDPRGNVMMRWPAGADRKRLLGDLQRLLKASQIG